MNRKMCANKIQISICASTTTNKGQGGVGCGVIMAIVKSSCVLKTRSQNKCSYLVAQMFTVRWQWPKRKRLGEAATATASVAGCIRQSEPQNYT